MLSVGSQPGASGIQRVHNTHMPSRKKERSKVKTVRSAPLPEVGPTDLALITYRNEQTPEFTQGLADAGHWRERNRWADYLGFIRHICFSSASLLFIFKEMVQC